MTETYYKYRNTFWKLWAEYGDDLPIERLDAAERTYISVCDYVDKSNCPHPRAAISARVRRTLTYQVSDKIGEVAVEVVMPDPQVLSELSAFREALWDVIKTLTPREEKVLILRWGLEGGPCLTCEEVALLFKVTQERIRQIELKAFKKMRCRQRAVLIKPFLESFDSQPVTIGSITVG